MINDSAAAVVDEIAKPFDHKAGIENFQTKPKGIEKDAPMASATATEMSLTPPENAAKCTGGAA